MVKRALRWLAYPTLVASGCAAAPALLSLGASGPLVAGGLLLVASALIAWLERVIPHERSWNLGRGDLRTDLVHWLVSSRALDVGAALSLWALSPVGNFWRGAGGPAWPSGWPLWAQVVLGLVVADLPGYWLHRLEHTTRALWRIHAVHHSAERLYWLNSARNHPLDNLLASLLMTAPLALLGAGERAMVTMAVGAGVHALLQHSNVDTRLGPFNWVVSSAEVHRWHHSRVLAEANANYGSVTLLWDLLFGTRRFRAGTRPPREVGLAAGQGGFPRGYLGQLASPLRGELFAPALERADIPRPGPPEARG